MKSRQALIADPFSTESHTEMSAIWKRFADGFLPQWVKTRYAPKDSWKSKPFSQPDADFFSKGILDLSEAFTTERARWRKKIKGSYFSHPRYRSGYLLYFLPMQMAKFCALYFSQEGFKKKLLEKIKSDGKLHFLDLGAGPATASLAWLIFLESCKIRCPEIEITLIDHDGMILEDAVQLLKDWNDFSPSPVTSNLKIRSQKMKVDHFVPRGTYDFAVLGNVLNEWNPPGDFARSWFLELLNSSSTNGVLIVEPASRETSQRLSQLRDSLLSSVHIIGPCPHEKACPLSRGRDYCHFSPEFLIPGRWYKYFFMKLGRRNSQPRSGKWSFLWFGRNQEEKAVSSFAPSPGQSLVISDAIQINSRTAKLLICAPERAIEKSISIGPQHRKWRRGDWIQTLKSEPIPQAKIKRR